MNKNHATKLLDKYYSENSEEFYNVIVGDQEAEKRQALKAYSEKLVEFIIKEDKDSRLSFKTCF